MHITRVEIKNLRSIGNLKWEVEPDNAAGWHVILGDNGSGKSTFTRACVCAILTSDSKELLSLNVNWESYLKIGEMNGECNVQLYLDETFDDFSYEIGKEEDDNDLDKTDAEKVPVANLTFNLSKKDNVVRPDFASMVLSGMGRRGEEQIKWARFVQRFSQRGCFSCSFGPFRRFSANNDSGTSISAGKVSRHISSFDDSFVLCEGMSWLKQQQFMALEKNKEASVTVRNVKIFVNQKDFLPYGAQLTEVTSSGVKFRDGNGNEINVEEMSDGYRSVLSLTFELLRQLSIAYGPDIFETHEDGKVTVKVPGVVQIDEVDAHLHPTWQKRIGFWFREHFPQMQFIVTTHSPLVCQAAEKGSIFLLPRPGTEETGRMLEGAERDRLIYGNILDAYSTEAFGSGEAARSDKSQELLAELSDLNRKEIKKGLSDFERERQEELRAMLPTESPLF